MPSRNARKIYTRSALTRRSTKIEPIAREEPKTNIYAYLDLADEVGFTPLHKAIVTRQYTSCLQLLSKGVDVNKPAANDMTALLLASRHGDLMSVQILLSSDKCDINAQDKSGWTALHHCAVNNHLMIAEMLLVVGADPLIPGNRGELPFDAAPMSEMKSLLQSFGMRRHNFTKEEVKKCFFVSRKGEIIKNNALGIQLEVPRLAINGSLFFICRRIPATCSNVDLGQSEVMVSDVYEFWPPDISFGTSISIQIDCVVANEGEEIVLKLNNTLEVAPNKDKQASNYVNKRGSSSTQTATDQTTDSNRKFSISRLGRMYVVSRLPKETFKIPLIGTKVQHSSGPDLSVTVPKNGLNSEATLSLQLYPVASDLVRQIQRQYNQNIISMGAICEVTHTDTEPLTRRLVTMTIPLPEDYQTRKQDGKLVVVSGTGDGSQIPEVIEKNLPQSTSVEFLTRHLTWKVAVLARQFNEQVLSEACQSVRKYTRNRMHFVSYLTTYKFNSAINTLTILLNVVDASSEPQAVAELVKQGFMIPRVTRKVANHMLCEGEISYLYVEDERIAPLSVAYFNKQASCRSLTIQLANTDVVRFHIKNSSNSAVLCEGEILI